MTLAQRAAIGAAVLFIGIVGFQLALALGAPWGRASYGGGVEHPGIDLRIGSAVAVVLWTAAAAIVLKRVGFAVWAPLPRRALPVAIWVLFGVMVVQVLLNTLTPSALERAIWLPVSALLAAALAIVAIASRRLERVPVTLTS